MKEISDGNKLLPNSQNGLPDAFNTLRIMKEAPILIIIENTNGLYIHIPKLMQTIE